MSVPLSSHQTFSEVPLPLEAAVGQAVAESLEVVDDLQRQVDKALKALDAVAKRARKGIRKDKSGVEVAEAFRRELDTGRAEARDLFDRQRDVLNTVNIALFGRTGAGKSSLIEALIHGDGAT